MQHSYCLTSAMLTLLLLFGGCSDRVSRVEEGNVNGVLHLGNGSEPQSIDPHVSTGITEYNIQLALYEGLTTYNPKTLAIEPGVATHWETNADGTEYTFYLRDDAKWSNGEAVTAHDFYWSWQRALNPALGNNYAYMLFPIKHAQDFYEGLRKFEEVGIDVLDPLTLKVTLSHPTPYFLDLAAHQSALPLHRKTLEAHNAVTNRFTPWTRPANFVGNGPFTLKEWKLYQKISVEKNPHYWDKDNVQLNRIVFYPIENPVTEERMFRAGQLHGTTTLPLSKINEYQNHNKRSLRLEPYLGTYYYQLNMTRPPLDDRRVRQALSMAIDRKQLVDSVLYGSATTAGAMTPPGTLGYYPPAIATFDPEKAQELLKDAGYEQGEGFPTLRLLYNSSDAHRKVAVAIQQMWKTHLGITITLENQEWRVYLESRNQLDYEIARAGWIGDYLDPINFLELGLSSSGNNRSGFKDDDYDQQILQTIPNAQTHEARLAAFYEAETYLLENGPFIPIYYYNSKYLVQPSVKGYETNLLNRPNYKYIRLEP